MARLSLVLSHIFLWPTSFHIGKKKKKRKLRRRRPCHVVSGADAGVEAERHAHLGP